MAKQYPQKYDKRLSVAKTMPPLHRKKNGSDYSVQNDRVLDWVKAHTDLPMYLIDLLARIGYINYNDKTATWQGVDYED